VLEANEPLLCRPGSALMCLSIGCGLFTVLHALVSDVR
jgi:hypothetical protein